MESEPEIMVVDWDIYLYSNFYFLPHKFPAFATWPMDCMVYNGNNIDSFKGIYQLAGKISDSKPGDLLTGNAIYKYIENNPGFKYTNFDNKTYTHLDACRLNQ